MDVSQTPLQEVAISFQSHSKSGLRFMSGRFNTRRDTEESSCAMQVHVHLPSGDGCSISRSSKRPISELKATAQQHLKRRLKLTANDRQLNLAATLGEAGLRDGDVVAAVVQLGKLAASDRAFAWHTHGGEVVACGVSECGGDSSQVQEQLRKVQHIQATQGAFAAILDTGACDLG